MEFNIPKPARKMGPPTASRCSWDPLVRASGVTTEVGRLANERVAS